MRGDAFEQRAWSSWEDEMWLATPIATSPSAALSPDICRKVESDNGPTHFDEMRSAPIAIQLGLIAVE